MRFPPFHTGSQQCFVEDMIGLDWIPLDPLRFQNPKKNSTQTLPPRTLPAKKKNWSFCGNIAKCVGLKKMCLDFLATSFLQQIPNKQVVFDVLPNLITSVGNRLSNQHQQGSAQHGHQLGNGPTSCQQHMPRQIHLRWGRKLKILRK